MNKHQIAAAVETLDGIRGDDPECAHCDADEVLIDSVPPAIRDAYKRVIERCGAWWYA